MRILEGDVADGVLAVMLPGSAVTRSIGQHEVTVLEAVHFILSEGAVSEGDGVKRESGVLWGGDADRRSSTIFGVGDHLLLGGSRGFAGCVVVAFVIVGSDGSVGDVGGFDNRIVSEVTVVV